MSRNRSRRCYCGELLEQHPVEKLLEATEVVEEGEKIGARIYWCDRVIGRLLELKDREEIAAALRERKEVLQRQLDALTGKLEEVENGMTRQGLDLLAQIVHSSRGVHRAPFSPLFLCFLTSLAISGQ